LNGHSYAETCIYFYSAIQSYSAKFEWKLTPSTLKAAQPRIDGTLLFSQSGCLQLKETLTKGNMPFFQKNLTKLL